MNQIGQVVGFIGMGVMFFAYQQRTQKLIMLWQIVAISIFALHFALIEQYTGALINLFAAMRAVLFYHLDKPWAKHIAWKIGFSLIFLVAGILTWKDYFSLFPIVSTILSTYVFAIQKPSLLRKLVIPCSVLWLIYNIHASSYAGTITECFAITSVIIAIVRYDILGHQKR